MTLLVFISAAYQIRSINEH